MREIETRIIDGDSVHIVVTPTKRNEIRYSFICQWFTNQDRGEPKSHTVMLESIDLEDIRVKVGEVKEAAKNEAEERYKKCKIAKSL